MNAPSIEDRFVRVTAYLTDEFFGYEHWRAAQFSAPKSEKFGVLILFDDKTKRDTYYCQLDETKENKQ